MGAKVEVVGGVRGDRQATDRTHVDACVALDAKSGGEMRFDVTIQAAFDFSRRFLGGEPELDLDVETLEPLRQLGVLHLRARHRAVVVAVAPGVHADLGAHEIHAVGRPVRERHALAMVVDRDCRLMTMLHCPDDVLGPHAASPSKNTPGRFDCMVVLSTTGILFASNRPMSRSIHGKAFSCPMANDVVHGKTTVSITSLFVSRPPRTSAASRLEPDQPSVLEDEALRCVVLDDLHAFLFRVL
jgi:hypothetical protein